MACDRWVAGILGETTRTRSPRLSYHRLELLGDLDEGFSTCGLDPKLARNDKSVFRSRRRVEGGQHGLRLPRATIHVLPGCGISRPTLSIRQAGPRPTEDRRRQIRAFPLEHEPETGSFARSYLGLQIDVSIVHFGIPCG